MANQDRINCYYAHAEPPSHLQRRCYWLLEPKDEAAPAAAAADDPNAAMQQEPAAARSSAQDPAGSEDRVDLVLVHYLDVHQALPFANISSLDLACSPSSGRIVTPLIAAPAPPSLLTMCAWRSMSTPIES